MPEENTENVRCWYFFKETEEGGVCKLCQIDIKTEEAFPSLISNLLYHLRRKHWEQWLYAVKCDSPSDQEKAHNGKSDKLQPYIQLERLLVFNDEEGPPVDVTIFPGQVIYDKVYENKSTQENPSKKAESSENSAFPKESYQENHQHGDSQHGVAFQSEDGNTVIWLQPSLQVESVTGHERQNGDGGTDNNTEENTTILSSGEVVQKLADEDYRRPSSDTDTSGDEEPKPKRRYVRHISKKVRFSPVSRPIPKTSVSPPTKTLDSTDGNSNSVKEDSFDHFGKYIASLLRGLPSKKAACKLQKEMVNWVMQEQMRWEMT